MRHRNSVGVTTRVLVNIRVCFNRRFWYPVTIDKVRLLLSVCCCGVDRLPGGRGDKLYVFRIISPMQPTAREIAASSEEEMLQWIQCIRECSCNAERAVSLLFSDNSSSLPSRKCVLCFCNNSVHRTTFIVISSTPKWPVLCWVGR